MPVLAPPPPSPVPLDRPVGVELLRLDGEDGFARRGAGNRYRGQRHAGRTGFDGVLDVRGFERDGGAVGTDLRFAREDGPDGRLLALCCGRPWRRHRSAEGERRTPTGPVSIEIGAEFGVIV